MDKSGARAAAEALNDKIMRVPYGQRAVLLERAVADAVALVVEERAEHYFCEDCGKRRRKGKLTKYLSSQLTEQAEELARLRKIVESDRIAIETNVDLTQQLDEQAEKVAWLREMADKEHALAVQFATEKEAAVAAERVEVERLRKIVESDRIAIETNVDLTQQLDEQAEEIAIYRDGFNSAREEIARLTEERNRLRTPENFDMALALDEIRELKAGVQVAVAAEIARCPNHAR